MIGCKSSRVLRQSKLINLLVLLCFMPLGTLGNNFHSLVHAHHCCSSEADPNCVDHSWASHILTWFDSANQAFDGVMMALEHQFDGEEVASPEFDHPLLVLDTSEGLVPAPLVDSISDQPVSRVEPSKYASGPIRAGPQWNATGLECGGDCHLSLVLRQVAVDSIAIEVELVQSDIGQVSGYSCPTLASAAVSTLGSRGPPSLA